MKKRDGGIVFLTIVIAVAGLIAWQSFLKSYDQKDLVDIHAFPMTIGEWKGLELPITEEEYAILETRNVFARRYTNPEGKSVYLLIVYSQDNRKVSHPPEICYTGSGVTILSKTRVPLQVSARPLGPTASTGAIVEADGGAIPPLPESPVITIQANQLRLEQQGLKQVLYYWFKVGSEFTPSYWKQQVMIAWKTLWNQPVSSALIRLSTNVTDGTGAEAQALVEDFLSAIYPFLFQYLP